MGHLTFLSKRLSAVGIKRISQFLDSACKLRSRVIALAIPRGFSVVVVLCSYIVEYVFGLRPHLTAIYHILLSASVTI